MRGKVYFTRLAAQPNYRTGPLPPMLFHEGVTFNLQTVVQQFSQLLIKPYYEIRSEDGMVYARHTSNRTFEDVMKGIYGDESPLSYLQAVICFYELNKYSPSFKEKWSYIRILDDAFVKYLRVLGAWPFEDFIRSLNPIFFYDSLQHPVIIIYTIQGNSELTITKHIHRFDYDSYCLKEYSRAIARRCSYDRSWERLS
ncbi:hypothetical protein [Halobacillus campisalis]|uniref:Uncharacterized protein n=1 Tax=Halobacillus campisalis TaxID=435909 RepID=A0ABW2K4S8_9BACI|nr:hypothetical protein [Halobacillus campisalis]